MIPAIRPQIYLLSGWAYRSEAWRPVADSLVPGAGHNLHRIYSQLLAQSIDRQLQSPLEAGR